MDLDLVDSVALVTGGSSGLGKASATALAREGADVAICARNADGLQAARAAVDDAGDGTVLSVQADITDDQGDIADLVDETVSTLGGIDHLVVSTGGPRPAPFPETEERDWYVAYDLLVMSVVRLARETYPHLDGDDGGTITVVGSIATREAVPELVLSSAVRRAAMGLVTVLSREFAPTVRANAVLPGPHETAYLDDVFAALAEQGRFESRADARTTLRDAIPLDRVGDPAAFGDVVAFLASERASYVTGAGVPVDGGALHGGP